MEAKKKLDILLMGDNGLHTIGGEQESTKIIINGIKNYFSIGVIQPGRTKELEPGAEYYYLTSETRMKHIFKHPIAFISYIQKVRETINTNNPTIIHTQAQVSFFIVSFLKRLKLISKNQILVHTERGLYTKYGKFIRGLFYFSMKELNVLVTTTEFNMKYWRKAVQNKKIDLEFEVIENTAGPLFKDYDINYKNNADNSITIGFAGRYCNWKNWPLAIKIVEELNREFGEKLKVKMAIGCLDSKALKETNEMFEKLNKSLGKRFEGKINIGLEEMNDFYYDLDFYMLTSNYNTESFGRTLVEAMSRRAIVLTTNSGGSVEVVGNKANICDSSYDFVQRVLYFYKNEGLMEEEKDNNLQKVNEIYSLQNNISKHKKLYAKILNK